MEKIIIDYIKVNQPIGDLYISKIDAYKLYSMAKSDIIKISKEKEEYIGIQREIKPDKVKKIKSYLTSYDSTFPNNIILNVYKKNITLLPNNKMEINVSPNTFQIIDGQHRLAGFDDNKKMKFELPVTIFINLKKEEQSRIFDTINSEQTKVDPSHRFYQYSKDTYYTPRKMISRIAIALSKDENSPWFNKIKLIGKKDELSTDGIISLNTFSRKLLEYIYNDSDYNIVRNALINKKFYEDESQNENESQNEDEIENNEPIYEKLKNLSIRSGFLWDIYIHQDEGFLYKVLLNYFNSLKKLLKKDWEDKNSILTKTTGYNAQILLFKDLFEKGSSEKNLSEEFFTEQLKNLMNLDGTINSNNYESSGESSSNKLYKLFRSKINI